MQFPFLLRSWAVDTYLDFLNSLFLTVCNLCSLFPSRPFPSKPCTKHSIAVLFMQQHASLSANYLIETGLATNSSHRTLKLCTCSQYITRLNRKRKVLCGLRCVRCVSVYLSSNICGNCSIFRRFCSRRRANLMRLSDVWLSTFVSWSRCAMHFWAFLSAYHITFVYHKYLLVVN